MAAHYALIFSLACALLTAGAMPLTGISCPEGWALFGSRCFKFFLQPKSWTDAETACHSLDSNLPSIHSEEENTFIVNLIRGSTGKNTYTWLGGFDAAKEEFWMWSDGTKWNYTKWADGEPSNGGGLGENNLMINWHGTLWDDAFQFWPMAYICSKALPPSCSCGVQASAPA